MTIARGLKFGEGPSLRFLPIILLIVSSLVSANGEEDNGASLLKEAYALRSSNPPKSLALLQQIQRDKLSSAEKDRYDFVNAYSLFINGKVDASISAFETLAENGSSANERFIAHTSLVNLYAGRQRWSEGFKALDYVVDNMVAVDSIDAEEQGHIAVINFYLLIGESELLTKYAEPLLDGRYSLRFICTASLQWLGAMTSTDIKNIDESTFKKAIERCQGLDEPIINFAFFHQFATYQLESGNVDFALILLLPRLKDVESLKYNPLAIAYYDILSQSFFESNELDKAVAYANLVVAGESSNFLSKASISAYETLYKVAELKGSHKDALAYYKKYSEAKSLNISKENAKMLSIQKAMRDSVEKSSQIALLDKENSLLKARAMLDEETARNRRLILVFLVVLVVFASILIYKNRSNYIKFKEISRKDGLTGIANRHYFTSRAIEILQNCSVTDRPVTLVMFDLDNFKSINDNHGHSTGDIALQTAVDAAQTGCRDSDLIGRLGGEEFGILLEGCSADKGQRIAESCRKEIERTNATLSHPFTLTASFGIASSDAQKTFSFDELFEHADSALYRAKHSGKNTVCY